MNKISIIGNGYVGKAVANGFLKKGAQVKVYDKFQNTESFEDVVRFADVIFACLPTPYKESARGGRIDLSILDEVLGDISKISTKNQVIVIKSTIIPGTTRNYIKKYPGLNICFNPEFLTEKNYLDDFLNADRIVIGTENDSTKEKIINLYKKYFPETLLIDLDVTSAELVKCMTNTFLATRVIFANEMFDLAKEIGADYEKVKEAVIVDKRIGKSHFDISHDRGFGGKCFPKDLISLIGQYQDLGIPAELLEAVWKKNLSIRKKRDWDEISFVRSEDYESE